MVTTTTRMATGSVLAKVQLDPENASPNAFVELGYSEDGFSISERPLLNDVYSDRLGGTSGEPVDVQHMGVVTTIRGKLTDFDYTQVKRLRQYETKTLVVSEGMTPTPGCLLLATGNYFRLLLEGVKDAEAIIGGGTVGDYLTPLNFMRCLLRDSSDQNVGSRVTAIELVITAYTFEDLNDSNRLKMWNRDTVA